MTLSRKIAVSLYQYYKKMEAKQLLENANQLLCKKDLLTTQYNYFIIYSREVYSEIIYKGIIMKMI